MYILTIYIGANENNNKHNGKTIPPNNKYQSQSTGRTVVSKSIGLIKYAMKPTIQTTKTSRSTIGSGARIVTPWRSPRLSNHAWRACSQFVVDAAH